MKDHLNQQELQLVTLLNELDSMIYLCRPDQHWTLEYVSEGCTVLTGYAPEDLLYNRRLSFADLMHPDDRDAVLATIRSCLDANQPFSVEYRMLHLDGSERWVWERGRGAVRSQGKFTKVRGFVQDITDRHNREKALIEAEQRYRNIFEHATEGIFQSTKDGQYLEVNPALALIYGYSSPAEMVSELSDIAQQLYVLPKRRDEFACLMENNGRVVNFESQVYRKDRSVIWISENAHEVRNTDGELLYYEGTVEDISERKSYEQLISYQATHDHLTDLPNRVRLRHQLEVAIDKSKKVTGKLLVVFIDLDHFKNVNDSLGHSAGDELIKIMGERLRSCVREWDTVARLGGDEFVLLLSELKGRGSSSCFIKRILSTIEQPCTLYGKEYLITCSIGVSQYPADGRDADTLLKNADLAMYKAKQSGRNNFQLYSPDLNLRLTKKLQMEQELRLALKEGQFELYYQPQFDAVSLQLEGVEALIRWRKPGCKELVLPGDFIDIAEEIGLIHGLGQWVIESACAQLRSWIDAGHQVVPVSINLSVKQFQQPGLVPFIQAIAAKYRLDHSLLVFELTESSIVLEETQFVESLYALKQSGFSIAIDDFGTGYCNMMSLKNWPFDSLKIDKSFVVGVTASEKDRAIYRAMIAMAKHLCLYIVAEGVETREQYDFLKSAGCSKVQGYYFGRPQAAGFFAKLITRPQGLSQAV